MPKRTRHAPATFAGAYGITSVPSDDWFDPKLNTDTDLFVDPFLMFDETSAPWNTIHDRMIEFFNAAMMHVAAAAGDRTSVEWTKAAAMLSFPEPPEFCLGYGKHTIFGSGSSTGLGQLMLDAAQKAIDAGTKSISSFGELLLFGEGFGADRISDMVCNIAKDVLIEYTKAVASRHSLPTRSFTVQHVGYDFGYHRWAKRKVELPVNPCWEPAPPVLLVPERFLDELPKMEDGAFWDWVYSNQNQQLRHDLGYAVTLKLKKHEIIAMAKRSIRLRKKYGVLYADAYRAHPPRPYDIATDPQFKVTALRSGQQIAALATFDTPTAESEFCSFVKDLIENFRWAVEDRGIWKSFWRGDRSFQEEQIQDLFHVAALKSCIDRDIDLTPEANAGSGPVDFKFSAGWKKRALVELKFAKSSSFWDNLEKQTPTYMKADGIACGYIVVVQHEDKHCEPAFTDRVTKIVARVATDTGRDYSAVFVDARKRPPASKLKR